MYSGSCKDRKGVGAAIIHNRDSYLSSYVICNQNADSVIRLNFGWGRPPKSGVKKMRGGGVKEKQMK